jgi:hypothetical protein
MLIKIGKSVFQNVLHKITNGFLSSLLSLLKTVNNEIEKLQFSHIEFKQNLWPGLWAVFGLNSVMVQDGEKSEQAHNCKLGVIMNQNG